MIVEFRAKQPFNTYWVWISNDTKPQDMIDALTADGWAEQKGPPPVDGQGEWALSKPGAGLFNGWAATEKRKFLNSAAKVLRKFGVINIPKHHMSMREML